MLKSVIRKVHILERRNGGIDMSFFEQLGKHLTDAGQNVAQQTQNIAEITRLNSSISEGEKKISQLFLEIGKTYYERHQNDDGADEKEKISEISALYSDIIANREKIKHIKGIVKCENCGADMPADALYCNACGSKVDRNDAKTVTSETGIRCPACHAVVEKDNLFCSQCGAKIENID
jgi:rRNA maturation endonuclease Nob1